MGSPGFFSFLFHSLLLPCPSPLLTSTHILQISEQTMSGKWFHFCDPPRVADSFPGNKIVQGLSNLDSFHWLTTIRVTPQDTEMEQMSRHSFAMGSSAAWDVLTLHPLQGRGAAPGPPSYPTPAAPKSRSTGITGRKSKAFRVQDCCSIQQLGSIRHSPMPGGWI